jgi:toxin CcdB
MAQFDVYRNPDPATANFTPYLLNIQADLLDHLATRVVIPLLTHDALKPAARLNPLFEIEGKSYILATASLAAIRSQDLGDFVTSFSTYRDDIIAAVDFLVTGF